MNHEDDGKTVVKLANPKSLEFQVVRTTLLPGLLKTIRENRSHPLPIKIFETGDVVVKDATRERQARNMRHAAAIWCNKTAGFEIVHGMLDRAMKMLEIPRIGSEDHKAETGYYIKESSGKSIILRDFAVVVISTCVQTLRSSLAARRRSTIALLLRKLAPCRPSNTTCKLHFTSRRIRKSVLLESCTPACSPSSI